MGKYVYLAWQDQKTRVWHVIGRLSHIDNGYEFCYTNGVKNTNAFSALKNMPEHDKVYRSPELFSLFQNRIMPKSRPEYSDYMSWMGIKVADLVDGLEVLAISGGERETDFFRIIPVPEKNINGVYSFKFFVNGLSHMPDAAKERVNDLHKGDHLYMLHDFQNMQDACALCLRTDEPPSLIGYIPAYFAKVIHKIKNEQESNAIRVTVLQVNKHAPIQMRLLCEFSSPSLNKPWEDYEDEFKLVSP